MAVAAPFMCLPARQGGEQHYCLRSDPLLCAGKSKAVSCRGLDIDSSHLNLKIAGQVFSHLGNVVGQFRFLGDDRGVDIDYPKF